MYGAGSADFVARVLADLVIGLADNVQDLDNALRENRQAIDRLQELRPDLWHDLKQRTQTRRTRLRSASHLTPASAPARNFGTPAPLYRVSQQRDGWNGQGQGSLFR